MRERRLFRNDTDILTYKFNSGFRVHLARKVDSFFLSPELKFSKS